MSEKLKPCPFCGGTNISIEYDGIYRWAECRNTQCETVGKVHAFLVDAGNTEHLVSKKWNTRPIEDALQSEIARLKEIISKLEPWCDRENLAEQTIKVCVYCEQELDWGKDLLGHKDDCEFITRERG